MALILAIVVGLGLLIVGAAGGDGDGTLRGCCFFAAVHFLVDDGILQGMSDLKIAGGA
jgi:hypothetical protein